MRSATILTLAERVMQQCDQLSQFSEASACLTRRFLSPPMHDVHRALRAWMMEAGMSVRIDGIGNIIGRRPAQLEDRPKILLLGSHLDTVPHAGKYDGPLGVLIALAVVAALKFESLPYFIDVIGFSEEEGVRYRMPYLGSRAAVGSFDPDWLHLRDENGIRMQDAIVEFGLPEFDSAQRIHAAYNPTDVVGYIETHLEQGPVLERMGLPVAIVDSIIGQSRYTFRWTGKAGHAGTSPMIGRRDALVGAARLIQAIHGLGQSTEGLRATVGRLNVSPNASNVIPAAVEMSLDVRHASNSIRLEAIEQILRWGYEMAHSHGLSFEVVQQSHSDSVASSPQLVGLLSQAMQSTTNRQQLLASGAGHDAVVMAERFPMAMLFIRHPDGISHHPDERVEVADVAVAIEVLARFAKDFAAESTQSPDPTAA